LPAEQQRNLQASLAGIPGVTIRQAGQDADGPTAPLAPDSILSASESILSRPLAEPACGQFPCG